MEDLRDLSKFLNSDLDGDLFVILKVKKEWELRYTKINKDVTAALRAKYGDFIGKLIDRGVQLKEFMPTDYNPESKSYISNQLLDTAAKTMLKSIEAAEDGGGIEHFNLDKLKIGTIKFIVIRFRDVNRRNTLVIRKYSNRKFLSNDKAIFLFLTARSLKMSERKEKVFPIDYKLDLIHFGDELLIIDRSSFNSLFGDKFFEQAKDALFAELRKEDSFDKTNLELMEKEVKSTNDKAKIANIKNSDAHKRFLEIFRSRPDFIADELKKCGENISVDKSGPVPKIQFGNLKSLERALNDDFVKSILTEQPYVSYRKEKI